MQFLTTTTESYISLFFTLALMLVLLYFMIYRPQKKQEKKDAAMRAALEIGDQVTTIGGVIGRVVAIKDDTFVLETGATRKIRLVTTLRQDALKGLISKESPMGAALMGKRAGDRFWVQVNKDYGYYAVVRTIEKGQDDGSAQLNRY